MIQEKSDDAITVSVPIDVTGKIEIQLMDKDKNDLKIPVTIRQVRQVVYEAVEAKKNGLPEEMITDLLSGKFKDPVVGAFGKIDLSPDEIKLLKDEKFSEKFISDIGGSLQYVTFGLAGIRLDKTAEVVAAPMLRIFIVPKSFYAPRKDLFEIKYNWLPVPSGLFSLDKWDLNIGLTSSASTSDNSATNDNKNYVLVGFSFEINRSALFNVGRAFVPGNTTGEKSQWYFGITVDQNFFKDIGFIK